VSLDGPAATKFCARRVGIGPAPHTHTSKKELLQCSINHNNNSSLQKEKQNIKQYSGLAFSKEY